MLNVCSIVAAILKMETGRNFYYDDLNWFLTSNNFYQSPFSKWPPQYRTNSTLFDFNEISYVGRLWWPESFWKWRLVEIFRCRESIRDIIIYPHMKCCWNQTMLNLCSIVVAFLKMATARNFSMLPHKFNIVRFQRHFICG
jgi:hypothetical protein